MNYGKKSTEKKSRGLTEAKEKNVKRVGVTLIKASLAFILVLIAGVLTLGFLYVKELLSDLPDASTINISPEGFQTVVYDADGNEIERLASAGANRQYVTLDEIPIELQEAFIAVEDSRFYEHNGVDLKGVVRALAVGITSGGDFSQGASTITQQLLKNNYFTGWTSENTDTERLKRKIKEQYLAVQLEKTVDKKTILENYLNTINLGQNTLGVEAASERYFNKSVSDLTLSECAVIAGITKNPYRYNPITHPEDNKKRREKVLKDMKSQGYITEAEYQEAEKDDVYDRIAIVNAFRTSTNNSTTYFVDALTDQIMEDLTVEKGYSESEAYALLYSGGLKIYGTQNPRIQTIVDEEVNNEENYAMDPLISFSYRLTVEKADGSFQNYSEQTMLSYYQANDKSYSINFKDTLSALGAIEAYKKEIMEPGDKIPENGETLTATLQPQVAMTVIDQSTGYVMAICGGRGEKPGSRTLNRATGITRQPGSTFKVIAAFAPALDAGGMTLASVQDDAPTAYANGTSLSNYDNSYRGFTNIRNAITYSINIVTVKTLTQISTGLGYEYVQDFGISTLTSGDNTQSLALGGITKGVTNLELAGAYATIANGGKYIKPSFYTKIEDRNGDIIIDRTEPEPKQVIRDTTAWLLTSAMKDVMTMGTGTRANPGNCIVAGKSGTTTKDRDTVFAGFSPFVTCVVWGGYDDNSPQGSTSYSKTIWNKVMYRIHEGVWPADFAQPDNIVTAVVCKKSGKLAVEGVCDADPRGNQAYTEYFEKGTEPKETCDHHIRARICAATGKMATEYCPEVRDSVYIVGGTYGTQDGPYLISADIVKSTCDVHTTPGMVSEPVTPGEEPPAPPAPSDTSAEPAP